ncbi:MAG: hypothetical protein JXB48_09550 [Candidatus Latescibacteria bacterium]|nr:hypothetical protein [Candidatus Latescibacterota bacterium]
MIKKIAFPVMVVLVFASVIIAADIVIYDDIKPVLSANCTTCHSFLGSYDTIMAKTSDVSVTKGKPIVEPAKPDESVLIWRLEGKLPNGDPLERMPQGGNPLSAETIQMFREWISQGATETPVNVQEQKHTWGKVKKLFR